MSLLKRFWQYLRSLVLNGNIEERSLLEAQEDTKNETMEDSNVQEKRDILRRTLLTKLNFLEQEIKVFEKSFPKQYEDFLERINLLRNLYNKSLKEIKKDLTFEIDPELDSVKIAEVERIKRDVKIFFDEEVRFDIISKRLETLIIKLNKLYNVSFYHSEQNDRKKVCDRIRNAFIKEAEIAKEVKTCERLLQNNQYKDRVIELLSYVDYEIFKTILRNSEKQVDEIINELVLQTEFQYSSYTDTFKAFAIEEMYNLDKLRDQIQENYKIALEKKSKDILKDLMYSDFIKNTSFWHKFLNYESSLIQILNDNKVQIDIIDSINISVHEQEMYTSPKTNAYLALVSIFSTTCDERVTLLKKFLMNLDETTSYKEIYFLVLLFDLLEVIEKVPNDLLSNIQKYITKYQYTTSEVENKKKRVLESDKNDEYVFAFSLDNEQKETKILRKLNMDFKIIENNIFLNSYYFKGQSFKNLLISLQTNTNNILWGKV